MNEDALLELRGYAQAQALTAEVRGQEQIADAWHELLRVLDQMEEERTGVVTGLDPATGEWVLRGGPEGLGNLVDLQDQELDTVERDGIVVAVERLVGRGWGMVRGLVRRSG